MRHDLARPVCLVSACAILAACVSANTTPNVAPQKAPETTHVSESKENKKEEAAAVRVELGRRYMQQGKLDVAMENLQKALQYDPNFVDAHTVMAALYQRIGNAAAADQHYARAAELAPKSGDVNNNYGQFLCAEGKYAQAQTYFTRAMQDPFYKTPEVLYANAGSCLAKEGGHLDEAAGYFRKALDVSPNNPDALYQMANVLYQKEDYFHARAFIQRFEAAAKPDPAALLLARNIELKLGRTDSAGDYARRLRQDFPDSEQVHDLDAATPGAQ
jgi:type IV pilus assembly protein PilF